MWSLTKTNRTEKCRMFQRKRMWCLCVWNNGVSKDQMILIGSFDFQMFHHVDSWVRISCLHCSNASSGWGATITVCGPAASLWPTSPPSCRGTSRSTRRQSAVPPMASNISPRGRSAGAWVRGILDKVLGRCFSSPSASRSVHHPTPPRQPSVW